jgi:hypothetical protein
VSGQVGGSQRLTFGERAAIIAAIKRRWAIKRAEAATTKPTAANKALPARKKSTAKKGGCERSVETGTA